MHDGRSPPKEVFYEKIRASIGRCTGELTGSWNTLMTIPAAPAALSSMQAHQSTRQRLTLPRTAFGNLERACEREWLVTNGLGGFAAGTIAQSNTRRYHGLLIAALRPPLERVAMVCKCDAAAYYHGTRCELAVNEFAGGVVVPKGCELLSDFRLEGATPVWTFMIGDALLEQRIWMAQGRNTTYVRYTLRQATAMLRLELLPLCAYRDYHSHQSGGRAFGVEASAMGCTVVAFENAQPYRLTIDRGNFRRDCDWYWRFQHRAEADRGLDSEEDLFRPGFFEVELTAGQSVNLVCTAELDESQSADLALAQENARQDELLAHVPGGAPAWIGQLTLAADQFIVTRGDPRMPSPGKTVIAGYPWFGDWGRDTMIALPGLALATGRYSAAASILRTFAGFVSQGMLPNRFPDGNEAPEYNTVDATLWFFHAIAEYLAATDDEQLLVELYPVLKSIISWHLRGTRHDIHVDPQDGLLFAGERGVQLTWMDAKIGDWVVTPRIGKPVEINALWHYALMRMVDWSKRMNDKTVAGTAAAAAERAAGSFASSFWSAEHGYLYDVIDGPEGDVLADGRRYDATLRPNQVFAVSLGGSLLDRDRERAVVDVCSRALLTPLGLQSLAPTDRAYVSSYQGGPLQRDGAYHQGTVWSWLLGPFVFAHHRVYGNATHALRLLDGISAHVLDGCVGSISEIFDATPPHTPRGCFAQAWSVAEILRAWHRLEPLSARESAREPRHD